MENNGPTNRTPSSNPAASGEADPYIGQVVAERYRVLRKLGEGGMGTVYLAEHVLIEKRVALKILSEDFARKADLVARFIQEAKAASRIGHENIIDITDFGETASHSVFFVMEFLDGGDLAHHIRQSAPMPVERVVHIMSQICRALGAAHSKGIIHRDLKPENIYLVEREGHPDFVKVLDFGIAKMSSFEESGARLTRTGMIFGTPEYMSPEQAKGDRPDHRVDIYAAGCILYEMLTGEVPFQAETFMGVLTKHMFEAPRRPSERLNGRKIPAYVEAAVMRALTKDREQRFQSMSELALALTAPPEGDAAASAAPREPNGAKRRSSVVLVAGVGLLTVLSGAVVVLPRVRRRTAALTAPLEAPRTTANGVPGATANGAAAPPPPEPAAPQRIASEVDAAGGNAAIGIDSRPSEAEVFDGRTRLGVTPLTLRLKPTLAPSDLVVRKRGFVERRLTIVADHDRQYVVQLRPAKPEHKAHVEVKAKPAPSRAAESPKATKLHDLKDPFAD